MFVKSGLRVSVVDPNNYFKMFISIFCFVLKTIILSICSHGMLDI